MKSVLFYWSKGAETRCRIIKLIHMSHEKNISCFQNSIADELGISFVAVKKHLDLLLDEGYVEVINPKGKPQYLKLTKKGADIYRELTGG